MTSDLAGSGRNAGERSIAVARNALGPLASKVRRARLALFWEALWPALWPIAAVVMAFAITALFGLWTLIPGWAHLLGLGGFALTAFAALRPLYTLRLPSQADGLRRLEVTSGIPHRPASAYMDALSPAADEDAEVLWRAHKARLARLLARLRAGMPRSHLIAKDPFALRVPLVMLLVAGFAYAGGDWRFQLATPFTGQRLALTDAGVQVDAWINPPAYTGRAPVFLQARDAQATAQAVEVPAGSELVVRVGAARQATLTIDDMPVIAGEAGASIATPDDGSLEFRAALHDARRVRVSDGKNIVREWLLDMVADNPPAIALSKDPETAQRGTLKLTYAVEDDYGVVSAQAKMKRKDAAENDAAEPPLVEAPQFALTLPRLRAKSGTGETFKDLLAHPWAGADIELQLEARDEAGNVGYSPPVGVTLPQRRFNEPLARAIVEQRRNLALSPATRDTIAFALDALTMQPGEDGAIEDMTAYLGLRVAYWRLKNTTDREALTGVVDLLWDIALRLEDGDLSLAERRLRDAQDALAKALSENADDGEIQRLMDELRQAMNEFLQELAKQAQNLPETALGEQVPPDQVLRAEDLAEMLRQMEELMQNGAREQAMAMLNALRDMMENLRTGRVQPMSPQQQQMGQALQELGEMIQRQQDLMDETFRSDQNQQGEQGEQGEQGQQGEGQTGQQGQRGQGNQPGNTLSQQQGQLQRDLEALMDRLRQMGADPGRALDQAGDNMGAATDSLGSNDPGSALPEQGEALENLRQGAQSMAEQLAQRMGRDGSRQAGQDGMDPLGRARPSNTPELGDSVKVPDKIDVERVRRILEELRNRAGDPARALQELEYLQRLLKGN